jgi:hypothetical protein
VTRDTPAQAMYVSPPSSIANSSLLVGLLADFVATEHTSTRDFYGVVVSEFGCAMGAWGSRRSIFVFYNALTGTTRRPSVNRKPLDAVNTAANAYQLSSDRVKFRALPLSTIAVLSVAVLPRNDQEYDHEVRVISRLFTKSFSAWAKKVSRSKARVIHNHVIELTGPDRAKGTCYVEVRLMRDGKKQLMTGWYDDEYVKVGDEWKFKSRRINIDSFAPAGEG